MRRNSPECPTTLRMLPASQESRQGAFAARLPAPRHRTALHGKLTQPAAPGTESRAGMSGHEIEARRAKATFAFELAENLRFGAEGWTTASYAINLQQLTVRAGPDS